MADKDQATKAQEGEYEHVRSERKEDGEGEEQKGSGGLLSKVGDPVGSVLGTALRPIGAPLEKGVTGPLGNALGGATRPALGPLLGNDDEKMEILGGKNKDSYESKKESLGGKEQTGDNPLGLDQTGRWGFREE